MSGGLGVADRAFVVQQLIDRAVASSEIVDVLRAAGAESPDISILSDEFLAEIRGMERKNLALDALQKLLNGEIRSCANTNVVESRTFSQRLEDAVARCPANAISAVELINELIALAKDLQGARRRGEEQGLSEEDVALPGTMAVRLQPNHPTDDARGIAAAIADGLLHGTGDATIGINPASDNLSTLADLLKLLDEVITRFAIPTQGCVLTHITSSIELIGRGAPVDLVFQSVAGTQAANQGFGITLSILQEGLEAGRSLKRGTVGDNVMYFETGQGSALSAGAHHDVDQQTLEARAYAVARAYEPLLVNTVVGFIGPEYLYDGKQIIRAGLEDHFCGKLMGVPLGCDICYTNHAEADQDDMDTLLTLLGVAGVSYIMGVPGADDVMLNYQSTSFHDQLYIRDVLGLKRAPEFAIWLQAKGITGSDGRLSAQAADLPLLAALTGLAA